MSLPSHFPWYKCGNLNFYQLLYFVVIIVYIQSTVMPFNIHSWTSLWPIPQLHTLIILTQWDDVWFDTCNCFLAFDFLLVLRGHSFFSIPATTANDLRRWSISIPDSIHYSIKTHAITVYISYIHSFKPSCRDTISLLMLVLLRTGIKEKKHNTIVP